MLYSEKVMDHFQHPRNQGALDNPSAIGQAGNPVCGDIMKIYLQVNDDGIIEDIKFETLGCAAAIAVSSALTELVKGKTLDEAYKITKDKVVNDLGGLPPAKIHCSMLGVDALHAAIDNYRQKIAIGKK
ncbi:iron-sulfur cluster assembly scaffold protein [Patescibacteria group bacterium]|jgi:nitrogen fixation NifU-like protein|nr:iron-sulfur cluster assembly scaffold protein [Patescibacteria group bacterium]